MLKLTDILSFSDCPDGWYPMPGLKQMRHNTALWVGSGILFAISVLPLYAKRPFALLSNKANGPFRNVVFISF
jgi:hypothetical protein